MPRRTVSSSGNAPSEPEPQEEPKQSGRVVVSRKSSDTGSGRRVPSRFPEETGEHAEIVNADSVEFEEEAPRKSWLRKRTKSSHVEPRKVESGSSSAKNARKVRIAASGSRQSAKSEPGAFVDPRKLQSEDLVHKTLAQTSGHIGLVTRPKVVDFDARLRERKRAGARYVWTRVLIACAAVAAVVAVVWLLFFSSAFRLESQNIKVSGNNEWVSAQQLLKVARKESGKSLILVSDNGIERELMEIPGVSGASVEKKFPNRLEVSVTAERPTVVLKTGGDGPLTAVDGAGRVLQRNVKAQEVQGIPVIEVSNVEQALKERSLKSALEVLDALPNSLRERIVGVEADTQDSVKTTLDNGITIIWGNSSDMKLKMAIADKIMNDQSILDGKTQIDVSAPGRPIIK